MFDWIGDIIGGVGEFFEDILGSVGNAITSAVWDMMLQWIYTAVYGAIADFFTMMSDMGAEIFDLPWIEAVLRFFSLFGWALFIAGLMVAVFDLAIESQSGRVNIKTTALNIIKAFMSVSLFTVVPIELYKFCITLQNVFAGDLTRIFAGEQHADLGLLAFGVLNLEFASTVVSLFMLLAMIALGYCVIKIFFANIKRGGILIIQIAVGSLYMFSVPRGYTDGFNQWCKQIAALCLTSFMQTTLLFLGLLTFSNNMLLGLGIMLSASEVPRIAQQFGLDTSVRFNVMNVVHTATTAVNLTKGIAKVAGK